MNNGTEEKGKGLICPFLNKKCIKERCGLWAKLEMITGSQLAPDGIKKVHLEGCPFKVSLVLIQMLINAGAFNPRGRG